MTGAPLTLVAPSRALVVASSTSTVDIDRLEVVKHTLSAMGWEVREAANVRRNTKRFAGEDRERAMALERALTDPQTNFALMLRGGYGAMRLLPLLDWKALAQSCVPFMGISDATAINLALLSQAGQPSWQGPSGASFSEANTARDVAFKRAFLSPDYILEFETERADCVASGILWGGNLAVLVSLLGTPYFPQIRGGILFLEDVAEPAFRIERMLLQLFYAGVLSAQSAVLLGQFTGADRGCGEGDGCYLLEDALRHIEAVCNTRFIRGLPFGHIASTSTIPVGLAARLELVGGRARLFVPSVYRPRSTPWSGSAL